MITKCAKQKRLLTYFVFLNLSIMTIGSLCLYQHRGMQMDETNHIWYKIVIKTRKDKSIGVKLTPNCLGNTNVFVKPDEQNKARFSSAMARKGAM